MREIKFRGKHDKEWVYGGIIFIDGDKPHIFCNNGAVEVDPATVGQFTGLLDGRGVKIYEGDIVYAIAKVEHPKETIVSDVVCDKNASCQFCVRTIITGIDRRDITHGLHLMWSGWASLNIIGNIHDNPELLCTK